MINLVVINNHTLGYITPERSNYVQVLHASVLRGSPKSSPLSAMESILISTLDILRLASEKDFDDFRVSFVGFDNEQEYKFYK